ncbi:MAG: hypothetical protein ACK50Q_03210 [Labrys sp. (in: a-proteobacteria)]|jgi:hypothetical protein
MRRFAASLIALATVAATATFAAPVQAQTSAPEPYSIPMTFQVIASSTSCDGCVVINAIGEINQDTSRDFALFVAETRLQGIIPREPRKGAKPDPNGPKVIVAMDSIGGTVMSALVIGRRIRELGWTTVIGQARMDGDQLVFDKAGCYSACSMMLLGGVERLVIPGSKAGIHQFSPNFEDNETFSSQDMRNIIREYGRTVSTVYDYAAEMGVDVGFFVETMRTPFSGMYVVPSDQWLKLGIATRLLPDEAASVIDDIIGRKPVETAPPAPVAAWTVARPEGGAAFASFADPDRGAVTVTCVARESARLDITLRGLSPTTLDRLRTAALARKRLRLGDREVAIAEVGPPGPQEQVLSAKLDARDLNALRDVGDTLAFAILDRSGRPAAPAIEIDGTGAAQAISEMMSGCGGV